MKDRDEERFPSGNHTWMIDGFSRKMQQRTITSEAFTLGGCRWHMVISSDNEEDILIIFLKAADVETLLDGWSRDVKFRITLIDQESLGRQISKEHRVKFTEGSISWGFEMMPLTELSDITKGYFFDDLVYVKVKIIFYEVVPPVELATQKCSFGTYIRIVSKVNGATGASNNEQESTSNVEETHLASEIPGSDYIEKAKHCLKECLSDLFKLNMRERLSSSLTILSRAQDELSVDQHRSVELFQVNFDEFMCDFLNFQRKNSVFELCKITRVYMYTAMEKNREKNILYRQLLDILAEEKEELNKKLKALSIKEMELKCDWETLMREDEEVNSRYVLNEKKLLEAEEEKKIAEDRMSPSTTAWNSLKEHFL